MILRCQTCGKELDFDMPAFADCPNGFVWNLHYFEMVEIEIPEDAAAL